MGFFFTALYILLAYLSPQQMIPDLAPYRPELVLGILAVLTVLIESGFTGVWYRAPQVFVLAAFIASVAGSRVLNGWLGGGVYALMEFLPAAICFYLVAGAVKSLRKLQILVAMMLFATLYMVTMSALSYYGIMRDPRFLFGLPKEEQAALAAGGNDNASLSGFDATPIDDDQADESDDTLVQNDDQEGPVNIRILRARALGFLNDPNDFAQFLITLIPLCFVWWRPGHKGWNFFTILLPCAYFCYGIYLTHSRGGIVGVAIVAALALRRKMGKFGLILLVLAMIGGMLAMNFSGGRSISVTSGSDRLSLWSAGLGMFKSSPIWGVGFGAFRDNAENTAHNSFILCLAELGIIGYCLWVLLLMLNVYQLRTLLSPETAEGLPVELRRAAEAVTLSFGGFLTTALFLSRSYIPTLYILLGFTVVLQRIAFGEKSDFPIFRVPRWTPVQAAAVALASLPVFYVVVNIRR